LEAANQSTLFFFKEYPAVLFNGYLESSRKQGFAKSCTKSHPLTVPNLRFDAFKNSASAWSHTPLR
jgi:hypothetical protein